MHCKNEQEAAENDCIRVVKYDRQMEPPLTPNSSNSRPNLSFKPSSMPSIYHLHTDLAALRTVKNPLDIFGSDA